MSIYGPPTAPPGRHSGRQASLPHTPDARAGRKVLLFLACGTLLLGVAVAAMTQYQVNVQMTREIRSLEEARRDARSALEAAGLESAERLPPLERPGPGPLRSLTAEDLLRPPAAEPADGPPAKLQSAELLAPPAAEPVAADPPARLQSAELIP